MRGIEARIHGSYLYLLVVIFPPQIQNGMYSIPQQFKPLIGAVGAAILSDYDTFSVRSRLTQLTALRWHQYHWRRTVDRGFLGS